MREQLLRLWPTEENARDCVKHEAETVDSAVFLAVHQHMQFLRTEAGASRDSGMRCDEQNLIDEFMTEMLPEGRMILPIVGSSGVGKSHVIRWLDAQLSRRQDRKRRLVIRIPKGTSLKGVLRLLLMNLDGPAYEELRTALLGAGEQLDSRRAARQLKLNLIDRLEKESMSAAQRIRDGVALPGDRLIKTYGDPKALPMLLGDSELDDNHWLTQKDGAKGVIVRMAEQVTEEAVGDEDTRRHEFVSDDLRIPDVVVEKLNQSSQRFYRSLLATTTADRLAEATRVLNRVLDAAKQDLLQLGDGSLTDLFRDVRAQLYRDEQELVLLVEDLAVLSGMQGALLQVMITEAYRDGKQVLCTMRSALAYTEGYANVPETVLTRARSRWLIEDVPGEPQQILDRVERLVGAYLNAARVGQQPLRDAFSNAEGEDNWIPIATGGGLEDEAQELVRLFGHSKDGYPLFPFNSGAIRQLTLQGSTKKEQLVFNPRAVINNVVGKLLPFRDLFTLDRFPTERLGTEELRSADVVAEVGRRVTGSVRGRILSLLSLWGNQPTTVAEAIALPEGIYRAFGLDRPMWGVAPPSPLPPTTPQPDQGKREIAPATTLDPRERKWLDALENWGAGGMLSLADARELRGWLVEAVLAYVPWNALLHKHEYSSRELIKEVYLPRAQGQGAANQNQALFVAVTEEELGEPVRRAQAIRTLMAFVRVHELYKGWDYDGSADDCALYSAFVARHAHRTERYIRARHVLRLEANTIPALTETLLIGARALGVEGAESRQPEKRLNALFASAGQIDAVQGTEWAQILGQFHTHRAAMQEMLLAQVGARQGDGAAIYAVDVIRVDPYIRAAATSGLLASELPIGSTDPRYKVVQAAHRDLRTRLHSTLTRERDALLRWHRKALPWFGEEIDKDVLQETLRETIKQAKADLPINYDYDALRRVISRLNGVPLKSTFIDCVRLENNPTDIDVLAVLARRPHHVVAATEELMTAFDDFLDRHERKVQVHIVGMGEQALADQVQAVDQELRDLESLLTRCVEVPS